MESTHKAASVSLEVAVETPFSVADHKDCIIKTLIEILKKETPQKFDLLKNTLVDDSAITSADILKVVVFLIFEKAVAESTYCAMYAQLCSDLYLKLPPFPSDEPGWKEITFRRVLLNNCQEAFEGALKLTEEASQLMAPDQELARKDKQRMAKFRTLGTIRFIGELFKQRMLPDKIFHHIVQELLGVDNKICPPKQNVEAICDLFKTIGNQLDECPKSRRMNDIYFGSLKAFASNLQLAPRLMLMVWDVIHLRSNNLIYAWN